MGTQLSQLLLLLCWKVSSIYIFNLLLNEFNVPLQVLSYSNQMDYYDVQKKLNTQMGERSIGLDDKGDWLEMY